MSFTEVMLASVVFAFSVNASGQLWGRSAAWSRGVEHRQEALQQLEIDLLRQERAMRIQMASAAVINCSPEGIWMVAQAVPPGASAALERRRLFVPAAHGLCLPGSGS